jgi:NTP pyrophosphatase (non-canonical NTP hydrolase)
MNDSSLTGIQEEIDKILQGYEKPYWSPLSMMARLSEESGEVARILNHKYGDKLADVLWTIICIANSEGVSLEAGIKRAIEKLIVRDKDRFKKIDV